MKPEVMKQWVPRAAAGWVGVDLDGTLAMYNGWQGSDHIGEPVPPMVALVKQWLAEGKDVRIFTARVGGALNSAEYIWVCRVIDSWCKEHIGTVLPITCKKDYGMVELWDDRCVQVIPNTGIRVDSLRHE